MNIGQNRQRTIRERLFRLLFVIMICVPALANGQGIEGSVINCSDSQPLAGVSVWIGGTRMGTATGNDGRYSFPKLKEGSYELEFSFIGLQTVRKEISVKDRPYQAQDRLILIYKTLNFDYKQTAGLNLIVPFNIDIGQALNTRLTLTGFYDKVKSSHFHDISFGKDNFVFHVRLDNTVNISSKPNIKFEINGAYISKNIQGLPSLHHGCKRISSRIYDRRCDRQSDQRPRSYFRLYHLHRQIKFLT